MRYFLCFITIQFPFHVSYQYVAKHFNVQIVFQWGTCKMIIEDTKLSHAFIMKSTKKYYILLSIYNCRKHNTSIVIDIYNSREQLKQIFIFFSINHTVFFGEKSYY